MNLFILLLMVSSVMADDANTAFVRQTILGSNNRFSSTDQLLPEYDFIIIGASAPGCVIANRLSQISCWNILLLEAGESETDITDIPFRCPDNIQSDYNYNYQPQNNQQDVINQKYLDGKGFGGTTILDAMVYSRGNPRDYDGWAIRGNPGWCWRDVLPYFIKSERAFGDFQNSYYHSTCGELDVQRLPYTTLLAKSFILAGEELGYNNVDYNSGVQIGMSKLQVTLQNGTRCSAATAFLKPIRYRTNLHISQRSVVTKINIDPRTKIAISVTFSKNGNTFTIRAKKEIILCAGTIATPQILMLSGIGPKEHLESFAIPVIQNLKGVGKKLQTHPLFSGLMFLTNSSISISPQAYTLSDLSIINQYTTEKSGVLTSSGIVEAIAYVRTNNSIYCLDYPDIEIWLCPTHFGADQTLMLKKSFNIDDETFASVFKPFEKEPGFMLFPILLSPKSRGKVELKSENPLIPPNIIADPCKKDEDIANLIEGIKMAIRIIDTEAFRRYGCRINDNPIPGCKNFEFGSDRYWKCAIQALSTTYMMECGTARMGPNPDRGAVVDSKLRVHGVKKLRVADASIMPRRPAAHSTTPWYMIGEKAADLIKNTYRRCQVCREYV